MKFNEEKRKERKRSSRLAAFEWKILHDGNDYFLTKKKKSSSIGSWAETYECETDFSTPWKYESVTPVCNNTSRCTIRLVFIAQFTVTFIRQHVEPIFDPDNYYYEL